MTATENLKFASVLAHGMRKLAVNVVDVESSVVQGAKDITPRIKLKHLLLAGTGGAGVGYGASAFEHQKQAAIPGAPQAGQFLGKLLGRGATFGNRAMSNAGDAVGFIGGRAAQAGKEFSEFMTKKRQLPNSGFAAAARSGFREGMTPPGPNSGFGGGFRSGWQQGRGVLPGYGKPPFDPRTFQTPPANPTPSYVGRGAVDPQAFNPRRFQTPQPPTVIPARPTPAAPPVEAPVTGGPASAPEPTTALVTTNRGWTGGPKPDIAPEPLWKQNLAAFKSKWSGLSPVGKGAVGYGGVLAASAPSTASNNAHAEWQQEHPVMSWLGQNFGGMQKYNPHSYLLPGFMQH